MVMKAFSEEHTKRQSEEKFTYNQEECSRSKGSVFCLWPCHQRKRLLPRAYTVGRMQLQYHLGINKCMSQLRQMTAPSLYALWKQRIQPKLHPPCFKANKAVLWVCMLYSVCMYVYKCAVWCNWTHPITVLGHFCCKQNRKWFRNPKWLVLWKVGKKNQTKHQLWERITLQRQYWIVRQD